MKDEAHREGVTLTPSLALLLGVLAGGRHLDLHGHRFDLRAFHLGGEFVGAEGHLGTSLALSMIW